MDDEIRQLIVDLYTPLETPARPAPDRAISVEERRADKERRAQEDLRLAREAARKAFNVRPSFLKRRAAARLLAT